MYALPVLRMFRDFRDFRGFRFIRFIRFIRLIRLIRLIPWPSSFTLVPVGALLAVFGFLPCRAAAMRSRDVFLFLGLGFHFAIISLGCLATLAKIDTMLKNSTEIVVVHLLMLGLINDGTGAHL